MIAADALLNAANARNINAVREFKKPDSSYIREYNKFKNHITLLRQSGELDEGDKFLTRQNVDLYFSMIVANNTKINPESARRIVAALQHFANVEEYAFILNGFTVESGNVRLALKCQKIEWAKAEASKYSDPHADLPNNVITYAEHQIAFIYV